MVIIIGEFKDYNNIDEYIEDIVCCLIKYCRYEEKSARSFVENKMHEIKKYYDLKYPAYDYAMDYYPICG